MTKRFAQCFNKLKARQESAFVPFVNVCDPDEDSSLDILCALVEGGADALELGIPFSDPCADDTVIQMSSRRALEAGSNTTRCFNVIQKLRTRYPDLPISLKLYVNLAYAPGIETFFKAAAKAGVDAVLIPDVPVVMYEIMPQWHEAAHANGINLVLIAPPNASDELLNKIASLSESYVYLLSCTDVTGDNERAKCSIKHILETLKTFNAAPALLDCGIARPEHVRRAIMAGADGVIAGSTVVKIIEDHLADARTRHDALKRYVAEMKAATKKA